MVADPSLLPEHRRVLARTVEIAEAEGWRTSLLHHVVGDLRAVLTGLDEGQPVLMSRLHAVTGRTMGSRLTRAAQVLDDLNLIVVDTASTMRAWVDRRCADLPAEFRADVRAWLLVLTEGGPRARPRSPGTVYTYLGRVQPHLVAWSSTHTHLREVTRDDVLAALDQLSGHRRVGTFVALRSLFGFAQRRRLIFQNPTSRLHVGRSPQRSLMPLTDAEIAAVQRVAVTPAQRLVVALAAVHAARATAIRQLTLDDIDLAGRRIRLAGHVQPLSPFVHQVLLGWLQHRQRTWPDTRNRHVLLSQAAATGLAPVSNYHLKYHLLQHGVQLELIRGDRLLQEALACNADPLHLAAAFNLSSETAITYSGVARRLLNDAAEAASVAGSARTSPSLETAADDTGTGPR